MAERAPIAEIRSPEQKGRTNMGGTLAELKEFFADAVAAFNTNNYNQLRPYLADNLTVYSINRHVRHRGAADIERFFIEQFQDRPQFSFPVDATYTLNAPAGSATQATITGTTLWQDENGAEPIEFNFTCVYTDRWLFFKLWAS
jgi:hypothetical protein